MAICPEIGLKEAYIDLAELYLMEIQKADLGFMHRPQHKPLVLDRRGIHD